MVNPKTTEKPVGTLFTIDNKGLKGPVVICSSNNNSKQDSKGIWVMLMFLVWLSKEMVNSQSN